MADKDRFFMLLEPLMESLERYVLNLSRNRELAKDIVSSTVLSAYDNFHKLRQEKAFLSYLFSIASRIYYAEIKRSRRENGDSFQSMGAGQDVAVMFQSAISPEDSADINILYNVMDRLEDRQREALILAELMGFSHREVADIQGSTVAAVKVRIHRAKKRLGQMLGESSKFLVPSSKEERDQRGELREERGELREKRGELREERGELREKREELREKREELREKRGELREKREELREKREESCQNEESFKFLVPSSKEESAESSELREKREERRELPVASCQNEESSKFLVPSSKEESAESGELREKREEKFNEINKNGKKNGIEYRVSGIENPESNNGQRKDLTPCPLSKGEGEDGEQRTTNNEQRKSSIEHRILIIDGSERSFYERN